MEVGSIKKKEDSCVETHHEKVFFLSQSAYYIFEK